MKRNHQKYWAVSLVSALTLSALSISALSLAQTVVPVTCTVATSSVSANQSVMLTASGGNGSYTWTGSNLSISNPTGSQFAVSYPTPGTYLVTVTSGGLSANCSVNVTAAISTGTLACAPVTQNVTLGQVASVSATGGNGVYTWSSPDLNITNANGSGFSANFGSSGAKTLTVTSAGLTAMCAVNVIPPTGGGTPTPGLPNTGGGYGQQ